jgi:polyhydroxybutyrate depolymerase
VGETNLEKLMRFAAAFMCLSMMFGSAFGETISVNGVDRDYIIDGAGNEAKPLIVALHGGGGSAREFKHSSALSRIAVPAGVVVVYPETIGRTWNDGRKKGFRRQRETADDVGFLKALVGDLVAKGIVDPSRVVFTGISNGGMMSFNMACVSGLAVYGIAPVSANMNEGLDCSRTKARLLNIVGTEDKIVPMAGGDVFGRMKRGRVQSSSATFTAFLKANGCSDKTSTQLPDAANDGMTSVLVQGQNCASNPVAQIVVDGGGHAWAGAESRLAFITGEPTMDFSASKMVVRFTLGQALQ